MASNVMDVHEYNKTMNELKVKIKSFEQSFFEKHQRKPNIDDIKEQPEDIKAMYRTHTKLKRNPPPGAPTTDSPAERPTAALKRMPTSSNVLDVKRSDRVDSVRSSAEKDTVTQRDPVPKATSVQPASNTQTQDVPKKAPAPTHPLVKQPSASTIDKDTSSNAVRDEVGILKEQLETEKKLRSMLADDNARLRNEVTAMKESSSKKDSEMSSLRSRVQDLESENRSVKEQQVKLEEELKEMKKKVAEDEKRRAQQQKDDQEKAVKQRDSEERFRVQVADAKRSEAEAKRKAEEERQARIEREAEAKRKAEEARSEREAEAKRKSEEERQARIEREAEAKHDEDPRRKRESLTLNKPVSSVRHQEPSSTTHQKSSAPSTTATATATPDRSSRLTRSGSSKKIETSSTATSSHVASKTATHAPAGSHRTVSAAQPTERHLLVQPSKARPTRQRSPSTVNPVRLLSNQPDQQAQYRNEDDVRSSAGVSSEGKGLGAGSAIYGQLQSAVAKSSAERVMSQQFKAKQEQDKKSLTKTEKLSQASVGDGCRFDGDVPEGLRGMKLKSASDEQKERLYMIKGRRKVIMKRMPLNIKSMNEGDSFILDAVNTIYVYHGQKANAMEKAKAAELATRIRDKERAGRGTVVNVNDVKSEAFWNLLGGRDVAPPTAAMDDIEYEKWYMGAMKLYQVTRSSVDGEVMTNDNDVNVIKLPPSTKFTRSVYVTSDSFVLDGLDGEIFCWIGKESDEIQRNLAMKFARSLASQPERPSWAEVIRCTEGAESVAFKEKSIDWPDKLLINVSAAPAKSGNVITSDRKKPVEIVSDIVKINIRDLVNQKDTADDDKIVDDSHGTGTIQGVYLVTKFASKPVDQSLYGSFWSGESYIILYKYLHGNVDAYVAYFYQGEDSSVTDKGTSAFMTSEMTSSTGKNGEPVDYTHVRLIGGKESPSFISIFKDIVIHKGAHESSASGVRVYDVCRRPSAGAPVCQQVSTDTFYLSSRKCFIVIDSSRTYVWCGKAALPSEVEAAKRCAVNIQITEDAEPAAFWTLFKRSYSEIKQGCGREFILGDRKWLNAEIEGSVTRFTPRFYGPDTRTGTVGMLYIKHFIQTDLNDKHFAMLDMYHTVYAWIGSECIDAERRTVLQAILDYGEAVTSIESGRPSPKLVIVRPGLEPGPFISAFPSWVVGRIKSKLPITDTTDETGAQLTDARALYDKYTTYRTYTLAQLQAKPLPKYVDPNRLEMYLSDADFSGLFKMSRAEFNEKPAWKQTELKKNAFLF